MKQRDYKLHQDVITYMALILDLNHGLIEKAGEGPWGYGSMGRSIGKSLFRVLEGRAEFRYMEEDVKGLPH